MDALSLKIKNRIGAFFTSKILNIKESLKETSSEIKNVKEKRAAVIIFSCLILSASVICYFTLGKKLVLFIEDKNAFNAWLDSFGAWGKAVFVFVRALQTVVKIIPGEPLEIAAGYAYGIWGGMFYCLLGSFLGSLVIIALTKKFGMKLVSLFVPKKKIDELSFLKNKKNLNITLFIIYLIPSTPKDIITYLISLTDENMALFLLITTIGRIPSVITSTWCGNALENENFILAAAVFTATAVCGLGGAYIYSKISSAKNKKSSV